MEEAPMLSLLDSPDAALAVMRASPPDAVSALLRTCRAAAALAPEAWQDQLAARRRTLGNPTSLPADPDVRGAAAIRRTVTSLEPRRRLVAVAFGVGWAVHACVLRFADGTLKGSCMQNDGMPVPLELEGLASCGRLQHSNAGGIRWRELAPEEYVVHVSGRCTRSQYLCQSITFHLDSGRTIEGAGSQQRWASEPFQHPVDAASGARLQGLVWDSGWCSGVRAIRTDRPI
mmetsp:Transcript_34074/g.85831  ORF Transcript_34074/g.85831 Transcript_34074/m.85831 type:complete len:231 (-) Transcript_34074:166-858(-)